MKLFLLLVATSGVLSSPRSKRQTDSGSQDWWGQLADSRPAESATVFAPSKSRFAALESSITYPPHLIRLRSERGVSDFNSHTDTSSNGDKKQESVPEVRTNNNCGGPGTVCVPYYQCEDGNIITDGRGLIDIRVGENVVTSHSKCERYLDVCCSAPHTGTPPPVTGPPQTGGFCGKRNYEGVHAEIVGFNVTQTQFGEFPWMVAILRVENIGGEEVNLFLCGGSLIQPHIVLTAAHCVANYGVKALKVRAGEWDTQSDYELYSYQDSLVSHSIIHPEFNAGSLWNDFALLILETPFLLAPNVDTVCLPQHGESFDHVQCIATGWGKDKFGKDGRFQNILKKVALKVVPHKTCESALKTTRLGKAFQLHESFICAGGEKGVDTCKGDGGSPLVCARPTAAGHEPTYYQVGIVAWGIGCGENGIPGVYADVTQGYNWVTNSMKDYLIV